MSILRISRGMAICALVCAISSCALFSFVGIAWAEEAKEVGPSKVLLAEAAEEDALKADVDYQDALDVGEDDDGAIIIDGTDSVGVDDNVGVVPGADTNANPIAKDEGESGSSSDSKPESTTLLLQATSEKASVNQIADASKEETEKGSAKFSAPSADLEPALTMNAASSASVNAIADGVYTISSALSSSARVDVAGASQANGARVQIYADNWTAAQRWLITSLGDGLYKIVSVSSGKALDVAGAKVGNGARVQQYSWNGTKAQQWKIIETSTGFKLYSALSSTYVLDLSGASTRNGTTVQLYKNNDTKAQRWKLTKIEPVLSDGLYSLESKASTKVLDVAGGSVYNSANVQQYQSNDTMAQKFRLTYDAKSGYYTVIAASSGLALDVSGAANVNGANVQLYTPNGTKAQKWAIAKNADATFTLRSAIGGRVLDVSGASKSNGANIQTWAWNSTNAQRWTVKSAGAWEVPEGVYNIVTSVNQSNSLAVANTKRANGVNVQTFGTSTTSWMQKWLIAKAGSGYYTIRNMNSRMLLDVKGGTAKSGTNVQQYEQNDTNAQLWKLELTSGGIIFRSKADKSFVLDVSGASKSAGANVQLYASNGTTAQKFRLRNVNAIDDGTTFVFLNIEEGKVLDVNGASTSNGASVQLYASNGTAAQKFRVVSAGSGKYYLQNVKSQKYVDVNTATKTTVRQWEGKSGTDKQWILTIDNKTGAFTIKSVYTGTYLDGTSGDLTLKKASSSNVQKFALQPLTFKLFLDAGHIVGTGGYDSGAVGNGYTEAELTADLTDRILKICVNEYGLDVVDGKSFGISYELRTGKAVEVGCTALVSIHFNAGGGTGYMSIVGGSNRRNANSYTLTSLMHDHLGTAMSGLQNNGISTRDDLAIPNDSRIAATLLEVAFIDNSHDMSVYNSRRDTVARRLAEGILEASQLGAFC